MNTESGCTLDLSKAPATLFLFGLAGSGKTFVGDLIAELAGWFIYHADDDLTLEMKLALEHKQPFTRVMREQFFGIITEKILHLQRVHKRLVITQAVYKQEYRDYLNAKIPNMDMILVDAKDSLILRRIGGRYNGISQHSAAALRQDFEYPGNDVKVIVNNSDRLHIVQQLNQFYGDNIGTFSSTTL